MSQCRLSIGLFAGSLSCMISCLRFSHKAVKHAARVKIPSGDVSRRVDGFSRPRNLTPKVAPEFLEKRANIRG
jgi:hypothetical protein